MIVEDIDNKRKFNCSLPETGRLWKIIKNKRVRYFQPSLKKEEDIFSLNIIKVIHGPSSLYYIISFS
jgi:hypothetical protein